MSAIAAAERVGYAYPSGDGPALRGVDAEIGEGRFVVVAGPSAGGKSTFLRLFNGLVPQFTGGRLTGRVTVGGLDAARTPTRALALIAGMAFQDPEAQAIADRVEDEVAFALEQRAVPRAEMRARVDGALRALAIAHLRERRLATLSGGERQRVAIAAAIAPGPRLLLLDEPASQLDADGAAIALDAIARLHRERGLATLVAEHRLDRLLPLADDVCLVEGGEARRLDARPFAAAYEGAPAVARLARRLGLDPLPLTIDEARAWHGDALARARARSALLAPPPGDELLRVEGLALAYGETEALRGVELTLREGETLALLGPNGSGKSSLLRALVGLAKARAGAIRFRGAPAPDGVAARSAFAGFAPQDPALALYHETVAAEIGASAHARAGASDADGALARWGFAGIAARDPRALSVGQQQRVAIAAMLAHEPPVWLLDEPTRGADPAARDWLAARLRDHAARGGAAIVATHDAEFAARAATRALRLDAGRVAFDLPVRAAFGRDGPMPSPAARLVEGAILPEDVAA